MNKKNLLIKLISAKLIWPIGLLLAGFFLLFLGAEYGWGFMAGTPYLVIIMGTIGGFVSSQRRLNDLSEDQLELMSGSLLYTMLAPCVGGVLAFLLYMLFVSGLMQGALFPKFEADTSVHNLDQFKVLFQTHTDFKGYGSLVFWSFVAGYSEKFVTNILGQFERDGSRPVSSSGKTPASGQPDNGGKTDGQPKTQGDQP
jgi:hypothetical protein